MFDIITDWPAGTIISIFIFLLIAIVVLFVLDVALGTSQQIEVTVIEKTYTPSSTSVGVVTGTTSNGNTGSGVVVTSTSEKYTLIVEDITGDVFSTKVDAKIYALAEKDKKIIITIIIGWLTKNRYA